MYLPRVAVTKTLAFILTFFSLGAGAGIAQEAANPSENGIFLTVSNPITSDVTASIKESFERATREGKVAKVIFDFNPSGRESASRDFGPCHDLAKFIEKQHQVRTVAYVRAKTTRHSVLPVLACQQIVMASEASLGDVAPDDAPDEDELRVYARIAGRGREALVLKMLDKNVVLLEGRRNGAKWFLDGRKRAEAEKDGVVAINAQPLAAAGSMALYSAPEARNYGLCIRIMDSRQEVAEFYQLPATSLREDRLQGRARDTWKIEVRGEVTRALEEQLRRRIDSAIRRKANTIILQLDVSGGSYEVARDLADFLRTLRSPKPEDLPVETIAFIPHEAPDTATFLALGCSEIVMGKSASFGSFASLLKPPDPIGLPRRGKRPAPPPAPRADNKLIRDSLKSLAQDQGYPPILIDGLFDQNLEIWQVRSKGGAMGRKLVTKAELDDPANDAKWEKESQIKAPGQYLELNAARAHDLGLARFVVDNASDTKELCSRYGIEPNSVRDSGPGWLQGLSDFLGEPIVAMFLIIIGVTCLILELKMPGIGVPGVIAALCFVLFFWSQSQMNGQISLLAVLLFLLGLVLIGIEVFLIPGFGFTGVSGVVLVLCGLGLATVDHMPQTSGEWSDFGGKLILYGGCFLLAGVAAFSLARYLPSIPYANRMVLAPPGERLNDPDDGSLASSHPELITLLGAVGTSATMLRPAGMAQFGDSYVDVVSEGGYVSAGARVQVIEIEGNRVVVKEV